jgi:hypothetical protein
MPDSASSERVTKQMEDILESMIEKCKGEFDYQKNMVRLILKTFKCDIVSVIFFGLMAELFSIINLFFTSFFVKWIREDRDAWEGYIYAIGFVLIFYTAQTFRVNYFFRANFLGINIRKAIS